MAFVLWIMVFVWLNWPQSSVVKSKSYAAEKKEQTAEANDMIKDYD